jgi:hypothetical protein
MQAATMKHWQLEDSFRMSMHRNHVGHGLQLLCYRICHTVCWEELSVEEKRQLGAAACSTGWMMHSHGHVSVIRTTTDCKAATIGRASDKRFGAVDVPA